MLKWKVFAESMNYADEELKYEDLIELETKRTEEVHGTWVSGYVLQN